MSEQARNDAVAASATRPAGASSPPAAHEPSPPPAQPQARQKKLVHQDIWGDEFTPPAPSGRGKRRKR